VVLDEPSASLDPVRRWELGLMLRLRREEAGP